MVIAVSVVARAATVGVTGTDVAQGYTGYIALLAPDAPDEKSDSGSPGLDLDFERSREPSRGVQPHCAAASYSRLRRVHV